MRAPTQTFRESAPHKGSPAGGIGTGGAQKGDVHVSKGTWLPRREGDVGDNFNGTSSPKGIGDVHGKHTRTFISLTALDCSNYYMCSHTYVINRSEMRVCLAS